MVENSLNRIESAKIKTYQYEEEPLLLHFIKTGFKHVYMIVYEDALGKLLGSVELLNTEEIKQKFNIDIENEDEKINKFKIKQT